jgi:hypothetical protein
VVLDLIDTKFHDAMPIGPLSTESNNTSDLKRKRKKINMPFVSPEAAE